MNVEKATRFMLISDYLHLITMSTGILRQCTILRGAGATGGANVLDVEWCANQSRPQTTSEGLTLQYAAAVDRADTFRPPDVIRALEDYGCVAGIGREKKRGCDQQAVRPVPGVRGFPESAQGAVSITRSWT